MADILEDVSDRLNQASRLLDTSTVISTEVYDILAVLIETVGLLAVEAKKQRNED